MGIYTHFIYVDLIPSYNYLNKKKKNWIHWTEENNPGEIKTIAERKTFLHNHHQDGGGCNAIKVKQWGTLLSKRQQSLPREYLIIIIMVTRNFQIELYYVKLLSSTKDEVGNTTKRESRLEEEEIGQTNGLNRQRRGRDVYPLSIIHPRVFLTTAVTEEETDR